MKGQFISNVFLTLKPDGSYRLIINLKQLNEFILLEHFKIEDTKVVTQILSADDFMITLDLSDAYYLININKSDRKFLRFRFMGVLYEFTCLPFGLCSAPFVFTKIMKPVILYLRCLGFLSVVYLDDFLLMAKSYNMCLENYKNTKFILEILGFIINKAKSCTKPSKIRKFLGLVFDSEHMNITLPREKRDVIFKQLQKFERTNRCKIREFAEFIGRLVFATNGLQYSPVYVKNFEREKFLALKNNSDNYEAYMTINQELLKEDFSWWKSNIFCSFNPIKNFDFKLEIFSDASLYAWGANTENESTHGYWILQERKLHINVL